ncbi:MAG: hypothetical protein HY055_16075 [Magnetospirillum sp.]|nr:hypothetical protein [Magnetospirillum sp.]
MWRDKPISLGQLAADFPLGVLRDGEIRHLGLLSTPLDGLLVPLFDEAFVPELLASDRVAGVLASDVLAAAVPEHLAVAVAANPMEMLFDIHHALAARQDWWWRGFDTRIAADAIIHPTAFIAARDVVIEAGVRVGPKAVILERSVVEAGACVGAGSILGGDGFEIRSHHGKPSLIPHVGGVRIGREAVIQAGVTIDRALFGGFTHIGDQTALADGVHIAHAVRIGMGTRLAAGVVVGGSTSIGSGCWLGLNASVANGLNLGDGCFVTMGAVVTRDVAPEQRVSGNYATDHARFVAAMRTSD